MFESSGGSLVLAFGAAWGVACACLPYARLAGAKGSRSVGTTSSRRAAATIRFDGDGVEGRDGSNRASDESEAATPNDGDALDPARYRMVSFVQHAAAIPIGVLLVMAAHAGLEAVAPPRASGIEFGAPGALATVLPAMLLGLAALPLPLFVLVRLLHVRRSEEVPAFLEWQRRMLGADPVRGARVFAVIVTALVPAWTVCAGNAFARIEGGELRISGLAELAVHEIPVHRVTAIDVYDGTSAHAARGGREPFAVITLDDGRQVSTRGRGLQVDAALLEIAVRITGEAAGIEPRRRGRFGGSGRPS